AVIHHADAVGDLAHDAEVMGDEQHGQPLIGLQLLTGKPVLYVCNVEEGNAAEGNAMSKRVAERAKGEGAVSVVISAAIEAEVTKEFEDAVAYVGNVPVFWFPKYRRSLKPHPQHFTFTPGYRSFYGAYLLTTYRSYWTPELQTELRLDYRLERGPGVGPIVYYDFKRFGKTTFDYYYTHDLDPGTNIFSGGPIAEDRDRFKFSYDARPWTNVSIKSAVNWQRDSQFRRDFFEEEFQQDSQPISYLEVQRLWPNFSLNILAQPQVNSFFDTIERLPDVRFTGARQQLGASPFYYETENSGGWYRRNYNGLPNFSAWRADSFHQILLPQNFFGWLNVTPRASGRYTHYGEADGLGATTSSEDRFVFNTGVELSAKASRVWQTATNGLLEISGLRHIVQPMVNYSFTPKPGRSPAELPQFDYEQLGVRPLPIDFPDYNSIDAIDTENTVRLGLRNQVQTRREDGVDNLVDWWMFTDWRLDPRGAQTRFGDFFSQLDFRPRSWLTLNSEVRYNFSEGVLKEANHGFVLQPGTRWSWALTHRFFYQDPLLPPDSDNNLFESRLYYRLNENWATRITQRFEARDGTLEEQYFTVYRDFRSITTAVTFRIRDQRTGPVDYTAALTLSLKAFPRFPVGADRALPQSLLGF
ncbi:MAG: LPS assembly protein LptD, partial [Verrucomicrobiae bacterium]|nr:LPS assembly protein LptD [Verrucomicrobiae bacterium]